MSGATRHVDRQPAPQDLVGWRVQRLIAAGFERTLAERLAHDRGYDLHAVLELVDRGCPPQLAARILAPLDEEASRC